MVAKRRRTHDPPTLSTPEPGKVTSIERRSNTGVRATTDDALQAIDASGRAPGSGDSPRGEHLSPPRRWTLARRLALLNFVLLAATISAFGIAAYRIARASVVEGAVNRTSGLLREIVAASQRTSNVRSATLDSLSNSRLVRDALIAVPTGAARDSLSALLAREVRPTDTTQLGWEIVGRDGVRRFGTAVLAPEDSSALAEVSQRAALSDSISRSPIYHVGHEVRLWTAVPIRNEVSVVGVLAELRRFAGSAQTEAAVSRLTGDEIKIFIASRAGDEWSSIRGEPIAAPFALAQNDTAGRLVTATNGKRVYVSQLAVPGIPVHFVLASNEDSVLLRPYRFRRWMIGAATVLLLLGTVLAWLLTRREVRPLENLRDAAHGMSRGEYQQEVLVGGAHEIAQLSRTFNEMSVGITEAYAELERQNEALRRANDAKSRFLAVMSHELRTPLNAIGGYAELIAIGVRGPVSDAQLEDLGRIQRSKDQLLRIISDILHFSRADHDRMHVKRESVSLSEQFVFAQESLAKTAQSRGVVLNVADTDAFVAADSARLQQVLLNLVINAIHFTNAGGTVTMTAEANQSSVIIQVADTGVGIPEEQLTAIFEPFVQLDSSLTRRVGGAGLGLSIVRELVTAMGGTIQVQSVLGKGSTFSVTLDVAYLGAEDGAEMPERVG